MIAQGVVAIATVVTSDHEEVVAVRPFGDGLVVHWLRYMSELRHMDDIEELQHLPAPDPRELKMAGELVESYRADTLDLTEYRDTYQEGVRAMLEAKAQGKALPERKPEPVAERTSVDFMSAMQATLKTAPPQKRLAAVPRATPVKATMKAEKVVAKRKRALRRA